VNIFHSIVGSILLCGDEIWLSTEKLNKIRIAECNHLRYLQVAKEKERCETWEEMDVTLSVMRNLKEQSTEMVWPC
jgi:hypothetical protein